MTKPFDPYKTLGVDRASDGPTIRKAYRKKAKTMHPDAGGDRKEFEAISRAVAILDDPAKRERFDRTGSVEDDAIQSPYHDALGIIMPLISAGVVAWATNPDLAADLEKRSLFTEVLSALRKHRGEVTAEIDKSQRIMDKMRKLAKRTSIKAGNSSPIALAMEGEARRIDSALEPARRRLLAIDTAIELVKEHKFDPDKSPDFRGPTQHFIFTFS